jgi:hypothetical protein
MSITKFCNFSLRLKKDTNCLDDHEQTIKHEANIKRNDNSTKYRLGRLGRQGEQRCPCVSKRYVEHG